MEIMEYIKNLFTEHRAKRESLLRQGLSYRSFRVAHENGYLSALADITSHIDEPQRAKRIQEALKIVAGEE